MPDMMEIYKKYAVNYDELVTTEDYQKNLTHFLYENIIWYNKTVYEAGIGTGRVTKMYIDSIQRAYGFDRESHMLETCRQNLCSHLDKLILAEGENTDLKSVPEPVDIFLEGWSFGHTIIEHAQNYPSVFKRIYENLCEIVKNNGKMIFIETLGTNVDTPAAPNGTLEEFYHHIETEYQFTRYTIATDYRFSDYTEAARVMGFFFGEEMSREILKTQRAIIPEFTGIWVKDTP